MGDQAWVILCQAKIIEPFSCQRLTAVSSKSVVGLGYEEEFGWYRRIVQHAL